MFKRGFINIFKTEYTVVSLDWIAQLGEKTVTQDVLVNVGIAEKNDLIKVLGDGELKSAITVHAHKFSKSAQEKITKTNSKAKIIQ